MPKETLGQNYPQARSAAQGKGLGLITEAEYRLFNKGIFEVSTTWTWLESGDNSDLALDGGWDGGVDVDLFVPQSGDASRGARRVLRISLA